MATISKYKSGYRAQLYVKGIRESRTFRTKREADAWAAARETELRAGKSPRSNRTLRDAMGKYVEDVAPLKRGGRWEEIRIRALLRNPLLPCDKTITEIDPQDFNDWRNARSKTVQDGTILREIAVLSAVLEFARRDLRWIKVNPIHDLRKPGRPPARNVTITRAQIRGMLTAMGYSPLRPIRSVSQSVAVAFLLALRSGMREGELCGLEWSRVHDGYCHLPETKTVPRDVPLTTKAMRLVRKMEGWDAVSVFGLSAKTLDALFRRYRKRAGLDGFTFHDSRHTAATWIAGRMRSSGIPAQQAVFDMCRVFGWSNINQALVYYNPSAADIAKRIS